MLIQACHILFIHIRTFAHSNILSKLFYLLHFVIGNNKFTSFTEMPWLRNIILSHFSFSFNICKRENSFYNSHYICCAKWLWLNSLSLLVMVYLGLGPPSLVVAPTDLLAGSVSLPILNLLACLLVYQRLTGVVFQIC